ncbi:MAG: hypothetical protein Q8Q09_28315 [Deltaproteobacteria bacterium]|nr:hypothetical protein [Deltaproteobacteria bacterium]
MSRKQTRFALVVLVAVILGIAYKLSTSSQQPTLTDEPVRAHTQTQDSDAEAQTPPNLRRIVAPLVISTLAQEDSGPGSTQGRVIAQAAWGSGPDQLGHIRPQEANPEAPMSFTIGADGTLLVVDQTNRRIQRFGRDGRPLGSIPLAVGAAQDIAMGRDGSMAVMDRLIDRTVSIMGPDGRERGRLALAGTGIDHTGSVTGVFVDGTDVYAERQHGPLVRVGSTDGTSTGERTEVPGRPTRDGTAWVSVGSVDMQAGKLYINAVARPSEQHMYTRELHLPLQIRQVVMLDSDRQGIVYLAVQGVTAAAAAQAASQAAAQDAEVREPAGQVLLVCVDLASGRSTGQATLPVNTSADETFREIVVRDEGGVVYAVRSEQGVEYREYRCGGH